jgi:hypothetical protein
VIAWSALMVSYNRSFRVLTNHQTLYQRISDNVYLSVLMLRCATPICESFDSARHTHRIIQVGCAEPTYRIRTCRVAGQHQICWIIHLLSLAVQSYFALSAFKSFDFPSSFSFRLTKIGMYAPTRNSFTSRQQCTPRFDARLLPRRSASVRCLLAATFVDWTCSFRLGVLLSW